MATSKRQTVKSMMRQSYTPRFGIEATKPEMEQQAKAQEMLVAYRRKHPKIVAAWNGEAMNKLANDIQIGGTHYKDKGLQPWDAIAAWDCGFLDGNVIKYVVRYRSKGGVEDLKKARHYLDKLIELEELK